MRPHSSIPKNECLMIRKGVSVIGKGFILTVATLCLFSFGGLADAQSFSSGSTGADGDLNITAPGVTVFDPKTFGAQVNPADTNIFNFRTITIAAGSTLKLSGANFAAPVYFLAQGDVTINGTIDLNGQDGSSANFSYQRTGPTIPGAGGYAGGAGGAPGEWPGVGRPGTAWLS